MSFASTEWVKDLLKKVTKKTTLQPGRIDGVLYQGDTPVVGTKDLVVYVSATGNDSTGDGSEAKPFKTLGGANMYLPKVLTRGYRLTLNISGNYSNVMLGTLTGLNYEVLVNFVNSPSVTFTDSFSSTTTTVINFSNCVSLLFNSGTITMDISKLKAKSTAAISFGCCTVRINSGITINVTGANSTDTQLSGIGLQRSRFYIDGKLNLNNLWRAVNIYMSSQAYIRNISGTGNNVGVSADTGSYVGIKNSEYSISATVKQQTMNGSTLVAT